MDSPTTLSRRWPLIRIELAGERQAWRNGKAVRSRKPDVPQDQPPPVTEADQVMEADDWATLWSTSRLVEIRADQMMGADDWATLWREDVAAR
ncbi:hypothetical protein SKAU_G00247590 [Synaphobranchus kaupii]|uniref:Uncharacterized protein n=1 Tax=Synaphobranchus kaupii TaxID=118154 RepID=A0A9Q1F258_SYNKA|nr:hypothetical protein SKAU_G00247590 [Synaphobranchus kaupii]